MLNDSDIRLIGKVVREEIAPLRVTMETKFSHLDARIGGLDAKVDSLDKRVTGLEEGVHQLGLDFEVMKGDLATVMEGVIAVNEKVDRMSSLEPRVTRCEEDISVLHHAVKTHLADDKSHPPS